MERLSLVPAPLDDEDLARASEVAGDVIAACAAAVRAPARVLRAAVACMLSGGHLLIEDVPGVGKTALAKSLARAAGCRFARLQCTADLLPADVTGVAVLDQRTQSFAFRPGPVFANVVLVDEINRASPKTQSALLECMEESQVTVDGETRALPSPFMVIATQNPVEYEGTYPLPEAQLDRFAMRVALGYPPPDQEARLLVELGAPGAEAASRVEAVTDEEGLRAAVAACGRVHADASVARYVTDVCVATREDPRLLLGASPRAGLALLRSAKALALVAGRGHVLPEDVKELAPLVLAHRVVPGPMAGEARAEDLVRDALARVAAPLT
ncbi:MAG: AAA family ATPase [Actinomycetota bacterium]